MAQGAYYLEHQIGWHRRRRVEMANNSSQACLVQIVRARQQVEQSIQRLRKQPMLVRFRAKIVDGGLYASSLPSWCLGR